MVKHVKDIRITDRSIIRKVIEEQKREGDKSATKTAGKIIERYFAVRLAQSSSTTDATETRRSAPGP